mgnify:CR=1 FL=1
MKKLIAILPLMLGLFLISCGDAATDEADGAEGGEAGEAGTTEPAKEIEMSSEMAAFVGAFDGDYESVEAGLALYGATEDIVDHDMGMYDLKEPRVTAKDGECYTVTCKSGMVENTYEVCWEGGKIVSITGG